MFLPIFKIGRGVLYKAYIEHTEDFFIAARRSLTFVLFFVGIKHQLACIFQGEKRSSEGSMYNRHPVVVVMHATRPYAPSAHAPPVLARRTRIYMSSRRCRNQSLNPKEITNTNPSYFKS
jgi:hypothetical protein